MKKKLKKYGKGGSTIKDPRQDSYYTPSSSDKKIVENIKKEDDIKTRSRGTISNPVNLQEFTITAPRQTDPNKKAFGTVYPDTTPPSSELASTLFMTPLSEYVHTPSRVVNYGIGAIKNKTFNFNPYQSEISETLNLKTDPNDYSQKLRNFALNNAADFIFPTSPKVTKALNTETGLLKDAYKLNPWAFKPTEGMMYRGLGKEGFEDAIQSGVFRPKQYQLPEKETIFDIVNRPKNFNNTYYTNAKNFPVIENYNPSYIAEVPESAANFNRRYRNKDWSWSTSTQIPINQGNIYKKDWLMGYKPVEFEEGGELNKKDMKKKLKIKKYDTGGNNWDNLANPRPISENKDTKAKLNISSQQIGGYAAAGASALSPLWESSQYYKAPENNTTHQVFSGIKGVASNIPIAGAFIQAGSMLGQGFDTGANKALSNIANNKGNKTTNEAGAGAMHFFKGMTDPISNYETIDKLRKMGKLSTGEAVGYGLTHLVGGPGVSEAVLQKKFRKDLHPELYPEKPLETENPFNQQEGTNLLQNLNNNPVMANYGGSLSSMSKYAHGGNLEHYDLPLHKDINPNFANTSLDKQGVQINAKETIHRKENGGDYVFSDSLKKGDKTFAEHSKKIESKTKKPYFDPASLAVKKYELSKLEQENDIAREKIENKQNGGIKKYNPGGNNIQLTPTQGNYIWGNLNNITNQTPTIPESKVYTRGVSEPTNIRQTVGTEYSADKIQKEYEKSKLRSTSKFSNDLTTGDYIQLAGSAVAPLANIAMSMRKPEKVKAHLDNTQYGEYQIGKDYNPLFLAENSAARDIDNQSMSDSVRRAARTSLASNTQSAISDYAVKVDNANKMLKMQQEQARAGTNRFNSQVLTNTDILQAQNDATRRNFLSTGLGQLGQSAVDFGKFKNQGLLNQMQLSTLNEIAANYKIDPDTLQKMYKDGKIQINWKTGKIV